MALILSRFISAFKFCSAIYGPSLNTRLSVPTSTGVQFPPMNTSPTGSGSDHTVSKTWTIPRCKADTGDGLTRHVSYTGQTSTRGKSVSCYTGCSKDSYAFENSNMREGFYSHEYHQTRAVEETASRFWEQDFRNLVIDRNHNTSLSEGSNFDMVTQSQVNGAERLPERLLCTLGVFVNPSSSLCTYRNETSSSSYMPHSASRLTYTLNIRIPGSQNTPRAYPVSNNLVACQTSVNAAQTCFIIASVVHRPFDQTWSRQLVALSRQLFRHVPGIQISMTLMYMLSSRRSCGSFCGLSDQ